MNNGTYIQGPRSGLKMCLEMSVQQVVSNVSYSQRYAAGFMLYTCRTPYHDTAERDALLASPFMLSAHHRREI
jgi:hypothetical protein